MNTLDALHRVAWQPRRGIVRCDCQAPDSPALAVDTWHSNAALDVWDARRGVQS